MERVGGKTRKPAIARKSAAKNRILIGSGKREKARRSADEPEAEKTVLKGWSSDFSWEKSCSIFQSRSDGGLAVFKVIGKTDRRNAISLQSARSSWRNYLPPFINSFSTAIAFSLELNVARSAKPGDFPAKFFVTIVITFPQCQILFPSVHLSRPWSDPSIWKFRLCNESWIPALPTPKSEAKSS